MMKTWNREIKKTAMNSFEKTLCGLEDALMRSAKLFHKQHPLPPPPAGPSGIAVAAFVLGMVGTAIAIGALAVSIVAHVQVRRLRKKQRQE